MMKNSVQGVLVADRPGTRLSRVSSHILCSVPGSGAPCRIPFSAVSGIVLSERVSCSPSLLLHALKRGITVSFSVTGANSPGFIVPAGKSRPQILWDQLSVFRSDDLRLRAAQWLVGQKIRSQRKQIRSWSSRCRSDSVKKAAAGLRSASAVVRLASSPEQLRGIEGAAARLYWSVFAEFAGCPAFFSSRSGHPALSPADSMLSFGYAVLANQIASVALNKGLDLSLPCLHQDRTHFLPLPWDLIEPLRAPCVDRVVMAGFHRKRFAITDFSSDKSGAFCMSKDAKVKLLQDLFESFSDSSILFRKNIESIVCQYISMIHEVASHAFQP